MFTYNDRDGRRGLDAVFASPASPTIRSPSKRAGIFPIIPPCMKIRTHLPQRQNCRTEEKPYWLASRGNWVMITRIREVRRARGLTLDEVARQCDPPTTAQTIGRLETGTRTVSIGWLNRIARALGVEAQDLVDGSGSNEIPVIAILGPSGATAPRKTAIVVPPRVESDQVAIIAAASVGDYRAGDEIWCDRIEQTESARALNRDVLVPRPAGRFLFGRLINRDDEKLQILPLEAGGRQQVVSNPAWLAVASRLVRKL